MQNASASEIKIHAGQEACPQQTSQNTGSLKKNKTFNAQLSSNNSDILPDLYSAYRKVLREKNTMALVWAGHAAEVRPKQ